MVTKRTARARKATATRKQERNDGGFASVNTNRRARLCPCVIEAANETNVVDAVVEDTPAEGSFPNYDPYI